ncbi:hypothetical protein [Nostoc sp.]
MTNVNKRPQVIRDLIELATYIAEDRKLQIGFLQQQKQLSNNWGKCQEWENLVNSLILI